MSKPILSSLKSIPTKDRVSVAYVEKGSIDFLGGTCVMVDKVFSAHVG